VIEQSVVALSVQDRRPSRREDTSIEGVITLVRDYAKQETLGPLKGAGKWIGYGIAGSVLLGTGLALVLLGLLRLIQTEWDRAASGALSWIAYLIVLIVCVLLIVVAVSRIKQPSLNKEVE
jgi:hypothetical protein